MIKYIITNYALNNPKQYLLVLVDIECFLNYSIIVATARRSFQIIK